MAQESRFPPGLPKCLEAVAFVSQEPVWKQSDCLEVIQWLSKNGQAVLGIELWIVRAGTIRTLMNTKSGSAIYCTNCDPLPQEHWDDFVQRAARLASKGVSSFRWPEDSLEIPDSAYFNLTWADREWFQSRGEFGN